MSAIFTRGTEDVYGTFNILMKRQRKENNFKAILESIRDLMNEYCNVPNWLQNIFLGYGNTFAAQLTNIPDPLETVDSKDMFLDSDHLKQSFPDYQVCFTNSDGGENWDPRSPFRIRLPKMLENNTNSTPRKTKSTDSVNDAAM